MQYQWENYCLDRKGALLTREGEQINLSRKQLDCITYLVEQRDRVVGYDELIIRVWGHSNVTNHQLSQMVVTIRRALGDDGRTQRMVRTLPSLGYRWVAPVVEGTTASSATQREHEPDDHPEQRNAGHDDDQPPMSAPPPGGLVDLSEPLAHFAIGSDTSVQEATPPPASSALASPPVKAPPPDRSRLLLRLSVAMMLVTFIAVGWRFQDRTAIAPATVPEPTAESPGAAPADPIAVIEDRLWRADMEGVRVGLLELPSELAESPDARMLEIRMYIEKRRYDRAAEKLENEFRRSKAAADTVWQARLLVLRSLLNSQMAKSGPEVFKPAQEAVSLLESVGDDAPQSALGEALSARGTGYVFLGQFESAVRDLVRARDILSKEKDRRRVTTTKRMLAHSWMRMGRLSDALEEFSEIAALSERLHDPVGEVAARNSATRIQIELLRWNDALVNSRRSMRASTALADAEHRNYTIRLHAFVLVNTGHLREATSLFDDVESDAEPGSASVSIFRIFSGDADGALADSAAMFKKRDATSNSNLILSSQEGALLLWMIAAQDIAASGRAMPSPSSGQIEVLQRPQSIPGRIARGRWLWSRGLTQQAESELRFAFEASSAQGRLFHMTLAAEPLVGLLLERKDIAAAEATLASLRGSFPDRMDRDYRVNLLRQHTALAKGDTAEIRDAYLREAPFTGERTLSTNALQSSIQRSEEYLRLAEGTQ